MTPRDLAVVFYSIIYWRKRPLSALEFSYHKNNQTTALLWVIIFMTPSEALVVHLMIAQWSIAVAWIFTATSLYSAIQLFGIIKSIPRRPISIEKGELRLRYGLISETCIMLDNISEIEQNLKAVDFDEQTSSLSPFGFFEGHNVQINLKTKAKLDRIYGFSKTYRSIAFHVDDKNSFLDALDKYRDDKKSTAIHKNNPT